MQLITALRDMSRYLPVTKSMQRLRLTPDGEVCRLDTFFGEEPQHFDAIILEQKSSLNEAIDGLTFPIGIDLEWLRAVLKHRHYKDAEAALITSKDGRPCLMLKGSNESKSSMTVLHGEFLNANSRVPRFNPNQRQHAVEFKPNEDTIEMLSYWQKRIEEHYSDNDEMTLFAKSARVMGRISCGPSDFSDFPLTERILSKNSDEELLPPWKYHASNMLKLFRLHEIADVFVQVYAEGVMKINVKSEHACYVFILCAARERSCG